jgi:hypothetical protein
MRRLFATIALLAAAACGENQSTGPATVDLIGNWTLQSVNGGAIPYTEQTTARKLEVLTGGIVIGSTGSFTTTLTERITPTGGSASVLVVTTYGDVVVNGSSLVFKRSDIPNDPGTAATLTSSSIAFTQDGLALVFVKS